MDEEVKAKIRGLNNRISGVKTRLKSEPEGAKRTELEERLATLTSERDTLRGPQPEKVPSTRHTPARDVTEELGARHALATALAKQAGETPKIDQLVKHAEKYGTEGVVESAIDLGYSFESVVRLQEACDRADQAAHRKAHPHAPALKFGSTEDRVRTAMGIKDEAAA